MKQVLHIARMGHPVLRQPATPVDPSRLKESEFQDFIDSMLLTMHEYEGVGLAGPQVHESIQLAVLEIPGSDDRSRAEVPFTVLVNPTITPLGNEGENGWEGCLSIPDLRGVVPRLKQLRLEALDRDGKRFSLEASGFFARVIQHECDHLGGHVYLDRMSDMKSLTFIKEFEAHVHQDEE